MAKDKDRSKKEIDVEIKKIYGYLNDDQTKVLALVSWNGREAKLDIRKCWKSDDGQLKLAGGISLSRGEVKTLTGLLTDYASGDLSGESLNGRKAVNFSEVFASASGIVEKREQGETTKDGFTVLRRRPGVKLGRESKD